MQQAMINTIRNYMANQPVDKAWVFGSFSRGEETDESDVDILVRFVPNATVTLITYCDIKNTLQDLLKRPVDLVEEGQLKPFAKQSADSDKLLIYEREAQR